MFLIFISFPQFENIAKGPTDVVNFNFLLGAYFYYKKIHPLPKHPKRTSMLRSLIFAMEHSQSKIGLLIILTFLCKIRIQCTKCVFLKKKLLLLFSLFYAKFTIDHFYPGLDKLRGLLATESFQFFSSQREDEIFATKSTVF